MIDAPFLSSFRRLPRPTPPRPRVVARVGVVGHRPNKLADLPRDRVAAEIASLLDQVRDAAKRVRMAAPGVFADTEPVVRGISCLAEGADRWVAAAGLDKGADLQCVLPFEREEYERDFAGADSIAEFRIFLGRASAILELNGGRDDPEAAYEAAGLSLLRHSDVLVAIWNGEPAAGRGGTAEIVEAANRRGVPVVWIDSTGLRPTTPLDVGRLVSALAPPAEGRAALKTYFAEPPPRAGLGCAYALFVKLVLGERPRGFPGRIAFAPGDPGAAWRGTGLDAMPPAVRDHLFSGFAAHHGWADALACRYAGLHRASFLANYLLGAIAVFLALVGVAVPQLGRAGVLAELVTIGIILALTWIGRRARWHRRWLDYRRLAEVLRHRRFLEPLDLSVPEMTPPAYRDAPEVADGWVPWLLRAVARDAGVIPARLDAVECQAVRSGPLAHELQEQIAYHHANAERMEKLEHRLHIAGNTLFTLTLLACLRHLFLEHHSAWAGWATLVAAVGPALGAALFGIRNHGEFARMAHRSAAMAARLGALATTEVSTSDQLAAVATTAAADMTEETTDWHAVFRAKPLTLPG